MIIFSRIIGTLLFLTFGTHFLFLNMRKSEVQKERKLLQDKGIYTFARISRAQKVKGLFDSYYYFNIKGSYNHKTFEKSERVSQEIYHLFSVGSNIQIRLYQQKNRRSILRIRQNRIPWSHDFSLLQTLSKFISLTGGIFMIFGFIVGPFIGRIFNFRKWADTKRPTPEHYYDN